MRKSILFVPVAAATVLVALTACEPVQEGAVSSGNDAPAVVTDDSPAAEESPAPAAEDFQAALGSGSVTYPDGLRISVSKVVPAKAKSASYQDWVGVAFTVTAFNGSDKPVDMSLTTLNLLAGTDGLEAEQVYDSGSGYGTGFSSKVAPGHKATAKFAFEVSPKNYGQIDIEVEPGFLDGYDSALFTGKVSA